MASIHASARALRAQRSSIMLVTFALLSAAVIATSTPLPSVAAAPMRPSHVLDKLAARDAMPYDARWVAVTTRAATVKTSSSTSTNTNTAQLVTAGQPCHAAIVWPARISAWTVPLGCYAGVFRPNPASYPARPSYGWCNWWPEVLHPWLLSYAALHLPAHSSPRAGAVVRFAGGVQGASSAGHYAQVVAIAPGGYWMLVTEMNFSWRGAGWQKVNYRFIHVGSGVTFLY